MKIARITSIAIVVFCVGWMAYFRLSNPDMTETRALLENKAIATVFFASFVFMIYTQQKK